MHYNLIYINCYYIVYKSIYYNKIKLILLVLYMQILYTMPEINIFNDAKKFRKLYNFKLYRYILYSVILLGFIDFFSTFLVN